MDSSHNAIEIHNLSKQYRSETTPLAPAVEGLNVRVFPGEVVGVLGAPGAGKSTLLKLLAGVEAPSSGKVLIAKRNELVLAPYQPPVGQTAWQALTIDNPSGEAEQMLRALSCWEMRHTPVANLTLTGQRVVSVLRALLRRSQVLLLDDPTRGLEASQVQALDELIVAHISRFHPTVVLASRRLALIRRLCDRLIVLHQGRLLIDMAIADLGNLLDRSWYCIQIQGHLDAKWSGWLGDLSIEHEVAGRTTLAGPLPDQTALNSVLNKIYDLGLPLLSLARTEPGAEDVYTQLRKTNLPQE